MMFETYDGKVLEDKDVVIDLNDVKDTYQVKEGHFVRLKLEFQVQRDMINNLHMDMRSKSKVGITVFESKHTVGSFAANSDEMRTYEAKDLDHIPSGMLVRGKYTSELKFTATESVDGKPTTVDLKKIDFKLNIAKDWA